MKLGAVDYLKYSQRDPAEPMGRLASDCSVVSRAVIKEFNGYDKRFGFGGADGDMARRLMESGHYVYRDPVLSVHDTKGFNAAQALLQLAAWQRMARPHPFRRWLIEPWHPHGGL